MFHAWLAILLFTQSAADIYNCATAFVEKRDLTTAQAAVDEALRVDARFVPALTLKAKLAMACDQLETAQQALDAAVVMAPKQPCLRFLLGVVYYLKNDFAGTQK